MRLESSALLTDLYQLTMLQGYFLRRMEETAVFEFFVRRLPPARNFLLAAGLEQVLEFLEDLRFTPEDIAWLAGTGRFRRDFLEHLSQLRFTGDVHAMPEGTIFFADEPILRVTAPLPQVQLIETRLINLLQFQTMIASKAARMVLAAAGRTLVDFGLRRAHGAEAGLLSSRASYLAGFSATATMLAGRQFGIPLAGTMAHSFILAHAGEEEAFEAFARANPDNAVFLLDTYDTLAAARKLVALAPKLRKLNIAVKGVRLDSGDLAALAREVRTILDTGGLRDARIFASGNLDEHEIARLLQAGAPMDGFGVGTLLDTSADAPYLECVYKLQEYAGEPRRKHSTGKATWPGRKQVFRTYDAEGRFASDLIALHDEPASGQPLLVPAMANGRRLSPPESLDRLRQRAAEQLRRLPLPLASFTAAAAFPVKISAGLEELARRCGRRGS
jgi:nicotinate phosphoribosyltransferase